MREGFTLHSDLLLLPFNFEVVIEKLHLLGVICGKVFWPFFMRQFEELVHGRHHFIAEFLRRSMVDGLEKFVLHLHCCCCLGRSNQWWGLIPELKHLGGVACDSLGE